MRALGLMFLLFPLLCLSLAFPPLAAAEKNEPPRIEGVVFESWPERVGDLLVAYVNASDPEGDEIRVLMAFLLVGEWAEGVPEEQRWHNVTAEPAPEHGPHCFKLTANTSGWLPGAYAIFVIAEDSRGARSVCRYEDRILMLRLELEPGPGASRWVPVGLVVLACLWSIMLVGFIRALRRREAPRRVAPVFWPAPSPDVY